jgi:hypothetical protein
MTGPVAQYECFDLPRRLFLMMTRMKGLPVTVMHDLDRDQATKRVRRARNSGLRLIQSVLASEGSCM